MKSGSMSPRRLVCLGVLVVFATQSCTLNPWRACAPPCEGPALAEKLARAEEVRVHKTDGSVLELTAVSVRQGEHGAFLLATRVPDRTGRSAGRLASSSSGRIEIPLAEIALLETRRPEAARSWANLGITVTVIALAVVVVAGLAVSSSGTLCPTIESFDGRQYRIQSEAFAGALAPGLERTTFHKLDALVPVAGTYRVRLANHSAETDYVDQLALYAVEHPRGVRLAFSGTEALVTVREPHAPVAAVDGNHRDVRSALAAGAGAGWESDVPALLAASRTTDELRLTFSRPAGATRAKLLLHARNSPLASRVRQDLLALHGREAASWYAGLASSPRAAAAFSDWLSDAWGWQVRVQDGGLPAALPMPDVGPIAAEDLAFVFDVSGVQGDTLAFTLSGAAGTWQIDHAAVDYSPEVPLVWKRLALSGARRGALDEPDGKRLALTSGEALDLVFSAAAPASPGMEVTPILAARGYLVPWLPESTAPDRVRTAAWLRDPELLRRHYLER
jgi:hypothetical protein